MTAKKKILIIDDDDVLRTTLKDQLSLHDEFLVTDAATATIGVKSLKADPANLVVLDVNLPDMDGREACKIMRRNGFKGPVIMLTGQGSDADVILGLDSGANDYVVKPFRFAVLLARIRSHLRQHEHNLDLIHQLETYKLMQEKGLDLAAARRETGYGALRDYGIGAQILKDLGIRKIKLITNHPPRVTAIEGFDLEITETVSF